MKHKDISVGVTFRYGIVSLRVEAAPYNEPTCYGCYFSDSECNKRGVPHISCYQHGYLCTKNMRRDGKHVTFVEV